MFNQNFIGQPLDPSAPPPHSAGACGKICRGGLIASHHVHRSDYFGRVAVVCPRLPPKTAAPCVYVQGYQHPAFAGASTNEGASMTTSRLQNRKLFGADWRITPSRLSFVGSAV